MRKILVIVVVLVFTSVAGAQIVSRSDVIDRLMPSEVKGGWVKIDKNFGRPGHAKVYCITVDGMLSCDWSDVRKIKPATLSENW